MKEKALYFSLLIPISLLVILLYIYKVEPFETFSLRYNDINFDFQKKEPSRDVVFVAVDEPSVNEFGRWPWRRSIVAEGIDRLFEADVVLMDMIFSEATLKEEDDALAESISSLNASVCGFFLREKATQDISQEELGHLEYSSLDLLQSQVWEFKKPLFASAPYAEMNILPIMKACTLSGSFSTLSESDHLLRSYPISVYYKNVLYPSLGIQGLRLKFDKDIKRLDDLHVEINEKVIGVDENGFVRLNFYQPNQYDIVSFLDVVHGKISPEYFKNKIVILGVTEVGAGDVVSTPMGSMPGALLHYTFISNLLQDHIIKEPKGVTPILILSMVMLPFILLLFVRKIVYRASLNVLAYLILYAYIRYLFVSSMIYIDLFYPLVSLIVSFITVEAFAFHTHEKKTRFLRDAFTSYLSPELLKKLVKNPSSLALGGESKELSILFSDIRGFTTLSESMAPTSLITLLNRYFTPMTDAILKNGGMLDKYIGDAVMAFFNAPVDIPNHAEAACKTALEMVKRLDVLNKELEIEGIAPIKIGIGINSAEVVVGNMGSDIRFNYTVVGDGVNLASRIEGLTKNYGVEILLTEFTVKKIDDTFIYREIEPVAVKGKERAVLLYELMRECDRSREIKALYDEALAIYKSGDFTEAERLFEHLSQIYNDSVSRYFLLHVKKRYPWGVNKMSTK